jgi:hypothetical protein
MFKQKIERLEKELEHLVGQPSIMDLLKTKVLDKKATLARVDKIYGIELLLKEYKEKQRILEKMVR